MSEVSGRDHILGPYHGWQATWRAPALEFVTTVRRHDDDDTLSFVTRFPDGVAATGTAASDSNTLLTSFPSL